MNDPYAVLDKPAPFAKPRQDDDELLPRRVTPKTRTGKPARESSYQIFDAVPGVVYLYLFGAFALLGLASLIHSAGLVMFIAAVALSALAFLAYGQIGMLVRPFQESALHGLACMFVPIYPIYYLITRWDGMRGPFLNSLSGIGIGLLLAILVPAIASSRQAAERAQARQGEAAVKQARQPVGEPLADHPASELGIPAPGPRPLGPPPGIGVPPSRLPGLPPIARRPGGASPLPPPAVAGAGLAPADSLDALVADLAASESPKRRDALRRLAAAGIQPGRREEVAHAIALNLTHPDMWVRRGAAEALASWGGSEIVPCLTQALGDPEFSVRWAVLDALRELKDPAAAQAVAALVSEPRDRRKSVDALKAMGSGAETAVVPLLLHNDPFVRMEACKILKEIGTENSVAPLQSLLRKTNGVGLDAMAAKDALQSRGASLDRSTTNRRRPVGR